VFRLFGFAGTGKTTLAKKLAENYDTAFMAYTGKAASVLRKKGCPGASTIHQAIYEVDRESLGDKLIFRLNRNSWVRNKKLLVIDEVSMVNEEIGLDLLSFGVPILVLGDPAQLPPVKGTGFFIAEKPHVLLTEIHRQASDNPIIKLATMVREYRFPPKGDYGASRVIGEIPDREFIEADQILVGRNETRRRYNTYARQLLGLDGKGILPVVGDKLICLRNNHRLGFLNGTLWRVEATPGRSDDPLEVKGIVPNSIFLRVRSDDEPERRPAEIDVLTAAIVGEDIPSYTSPEVIQMDFGYAITVHKSQGSEWSNVIVLNESGAFRDHRWKWLYTAITRASERVTLVTR
jgi:exodeoxyribonuclease-5